MVRTKDGLKMLFRAENYNCLYIFYCFTILTPYFDIGGDQLHSNLTCLCTLLCYIDIVWSASPIIIRRIFRGRASSLRESKIITHSLFPQVDFFFDNNSRMVFIRM